MVKYFYLVIIFERERERMTRVCVPPVRRSWADDNDDDPLEELFHLPNSGRSKVPVAAPVKVEPVAPVADPVAAPVKVVRNAPVAVPVAGPAVIFLGEDPINEQVNSLINLLQNGGAIPLFGDDPNGQADLGTLEVRNALRTKIYHLCRTGVISIEQVQHFLSTHNVRIRCWFGEGCRNHQHEGCTFWYGHFIDGHPPNPPASGGGRGRKSP